LSKSPLDRYIAVLPSSVPILGLEFPISYEINLRDADDSVLYGDLDRSTKRIRIAIRPPAQMRRVLLHEMFHGIMLQSGWYELLKAIAVDHAEEGLNSLIEENLGPYVTFIDTIWPEKKIDKVYESVREEIEGLIAP